MKKLLAALAFTVLSATSFAQEQGTIDVQFTFGGVSSNDLLDMAENTISSGLADEEKFKDELNEFTYNLAVKYAIKDNWFVNAEGSMQKLDQQILKNKSQIGTIENNFTTLALGTEYHYLNTNWVQLYSGGSVAYTIHNSDLDYETLTDRKLNDNYLNFQVNALGARIGKSFAGVAELGFGYQGVLKLGASYQF